MQVLLQQPQRDRTEIYMDILDLCRQSKTVWNIMRLGNFSYGVREYLRVLEAAGCLRALKNERARTIYLTSEKGLMLLEAIRNVQNLLGRKRLERTVVCKTV